MPKTTNEELHQLTRDYGIGLAISTPPIVPKGEMAFRAGLRPEPSGETT